MCEVRALWCFVVARFISNVFIHTLGADSTQNSWNLIRRKILFSCPIVLKFCTERGSITVMPWSKPQNDRVNDTKHHIMTSYIYIYITSLSEWKISLKIPSLKETTLYEDFGARSRYFRQGKVIPSHSTLWDAITNPCLRYLLLVPKSSHDR